jgi:exo beta-1,2-glucooligosaccharide sophorohydrolase (non-reducing end)
MLLSRSGIAGGATLAVPLLFCAISGRADTAYFERTFFDNSITSDSYFHSAGRPSSPSTLELIGNKLPVDTSTFFTPPNALRLHWNSRPGGGWEAEVDLYEWRNRNVYFPGNALLFWCYAPQGLSARNLPHLVLRDENRNFSSPLDLARLVKDIPAGQWTRIRIPMDRFTTASIRAFDAHRVNAVCFVQGASDQAEHTLLIDEIRIDNETPSTKAAALSPPSEIHERIRTAHRCELELRR